MQNRTEGSRQAQPDQNDVSDATVGKPSTSCPNGVTWCRRHEDDGDYCWSRTIYVREAQVAFSNGTNDGRLKLWGLAEFEDDAIEIDVAQQVAEAITALLAEVQR